jgi:hypothetical protein
MKYRGKIWHLNQEIKTSERKLLKIVETLFRTQLELQRDHQNEVQETMDFRFLEFQLKD